MPVSVSEMATGVDPIQANNPSPEINRLAELARQLAQSQANFLDQVIYLVG